MHRAIRHALVLAIAAGCLMASALAGAQDKFPSRPVTLIIPWPPGGPTDVVGRLVAQRLGVLWNQTVISENKPGASGTVGTNMIAKAAPDGYTIGIHTGVSPAFELLNPKLMRYSTLRDLASIGFIATTPLIVAVRADFPAKDIHEFIAYAKANPTKVTYASAGAGSPPQFAAEFLKQAAGINMLHVPFAGTQPAVQAVMAGNVDIYIGSVTSVMSAVDSGKARMLGAVASQRISAVPNLPTLTELGVPNVSGEAWYGVVGPTGIPVPILERMNADLNSVLGGDEMLAQLRKIGFERRLGTRADFDKFVRDDIEKTRRIIIDAKIEASN
jgi:tripartite-type tricarboxylate transporter receptor subunit TctC